MPEAPAATPTTDAAATPAAAVPAGAGAALVADAKPAADAGKPVEKADADPAADLEKQWAEFKAPEGLDKAMLKEVVDFARQAGIPPKAAAALALRDKARADKEEAEFKHLSEKGWLEELQKDAVLGGEKTRETMVNVMRAADKLPRDVQAMIKEQGVIYNPLVVRILHAFGTGLKEDGFVRPGASPAQEKKMSLDERLEMTFSGAAK